MWYHLAWLGESVRRTDSRVTELMAIGEQFDLAQRRTLFDVIADCLAQLQPRYRRLADTGRIEPIMSPFAHPILPLLIDFESARVRNKQAP